LLSAECRVDQVADLCWRYVEKGHPDTPLLLEALTRGYLQQYRLGKVRICLDRWRQLQPDNPQAWYLEGLFLFDYLHASAAAMDSYRRAVELDPEHEEARLGLAVALLGDKNFTEAAEHFEHLRQCQLDNLSVQVGLAECLDGLGRQVEAEQLVDAVLVRQPNFAPALSLRGQFALKSGQLAEAETWLRQALQRKPTDHRARYNLSLCLERNGKEEEARQEQRQLRQMEEDLARFNEIVTKEIAQRPTDPALHFTLGQILLRSGQKEEGLRWIQSALRLDPQYAPARQALAE
jgi:tetratricopeptide (TPR) repeat protein